MEFWKTCQALHSEGLSSQRLKLWKKPARGPGCPSYRASPFVPLLLINLDEFQTSLLALRLSLSCPSDLAKNEEWHFSTVSAQFSWTFFLKMGFTVFNSKLSVTESYIIISCWRGQRLNCMGTNMQVKSENILSKIWRGQKKKKIQIFLNTQISLRYFDGKS